MGIHQLFTFLNQRSNRISKINPVKSFIGRTIAIDASMSLYAFMVAIRDSEGIGGLSNEDGENTSHIAGMLSRATKLIESGLVPVYVFDGKAPDIKAGELASRKLAKENAEASYKEAEKAGDKEQMAKFLKRTVRVTSTHVNDVIELFSYMGVATVRAPGEAEAQCARLTKENLVYAAGTEDADVLTFGAKRMIRSLHVSEAKQKIQPTCIIELETVLEELDFTMDQFIDFCILCGCDYCPTIRGVGPSNAYNLISKHKDIETIIQNLDPRFKLPDNFNFETARAEFKNPNTISGHDCNLKANPPDCEKLKEFLVEKHNFNPAKVDSYIVRLQKCNKSMKQSRLDNFFTIVKPSKTQGTEKSTVKANFAKRKTKTSFKKK